MTERPAPSLPREILGLAVPAFATLVAEPLLLMADSAMVAHLGTTQLAGLGLAANVLGLLIGLSIFLAYGTTASVARRIGAGDRAGGLAQGLDGMLLAVGLGALLALLLELVAPVVLGWYGAPPDVTAQGVRYLRVAALGLPSVLLMLASTGVLRGLKDTRTPLVVAITMNLINIGLNYVLIFVAGLGIVGSALGTALAQTISAVILAAVVIRGARAAGTHLVFRPAGVLAAARSGVWLVIRTAWLQLSLVATTTVAAHTGAIGLASHQVTNAVWAFLCMALDALAIAAQAMVGTELGAARKDRARTITTLLCWWGLAGGVLFGGLLALVRSPLGHLFTPDPDVRATLAKTFLALALVCPAAGVVFVLDGVLIGAGDARYLALAGGIATLTYLPFVLLVDRLQAGVVWLWLAYNLYMLARLATLLWRSTRDAWMRLGA